MRTLLFAAVVFGAAAGSVAAQTTPAPMPSTPPTVEFTTPPSCVVDCAPACCPCGPPGRFWVEGDYLLWATSGSRLPPLITAAPPGTTNFGELGAPDTTVLFGNQRVDDNMRSGFRLRAGFWLDECHECGVEASFFYLSPTGKNFLVGSDGTNVALFRPFVNALTGAPDAEDVSFLTDGVTGQVGVQNKSDFLGGDVNFRHKLCCCDDCCQGYRIDLLAGYRSEGLRESLEINENLTLLPPGNPAGTDQVQDRFRTSNVFHGLQLGLDGQWWRNRWFLDFRALAALGLTHQTVDIEGVTIQTPAGGTPMVFPGGLLALPSNIGHYTRDPFTFVPTLGVSVGRQLTDCVRVSVGYDLTYWTSVVHPGNQIDPVVNPNQLPPPLPPISPLRPAFHFQGSDFWAQGLNVAVEFRY